MLTVDALSVQLYTVRERLADDLSGTLGRLAEIGFRQVEPYALTEYADQLATALPAHGLTAPTTHNGLVGQEHDAVLTVARDLGVRTVIDPMTDPARWTSAASITEIAAELNAAAETAARYGLQVGYHNHAFELETMIDGRHALEVFADQLDPAVRLEVDTYWAYTGGADVPALLRRLGDRVIALHLKDGDGSMDTTRQVAVGSGSLPVWDFVDAAPSARYGVVELDDSAGDRLEAVAASFRYLTKEK